jgi:hypothetical protein
MATACGWIQVKSLPVALLVPSAPNGLLAGGESKLSPFLATRFSDTGT